MGGGIPIETMTRGKVKQQQQWHFTFFGSL